MNSRDRLMLALNKEKPDRLPCATMDMMQYWLDTEMDGMTLIEASRAIGLDATVFAPNPPYWPYSPSFQSPEWKITTKVWEDDKGHNVKYHIETPKGKLSMTQTTNQYTTWCSEYLIKNDEDIKLLRFRPIWPFDKKRFAELYDEIGDDGIIRTGGYGFQEGPWQDACEMYGTEQMIYAAFDKPEWVHEFLQTLLDHKLKFYEMALPGLKCDLILNGGGAGSNTVISPAIHEEFCLPYDQQIHAAIRSLSDIKIVYHTCGGMTRILDSILQNGCDASESLSPVICGGDIIDPSVVTDKFKGRLAMIGGFDQMNILRYGTKKEIGNEVHRLFDGFGRDGGYIMMCSDHFFHAPKENLKFYVEAAKECVY